MACLSQSYPLPFGEVSFAHPLSPLLLCNIDTPGVLLRLKSVLYHRILNSAYHDTGFLKQHEWDSDSFNRPRRTRYSQNFLITSRLLFSDENMSFHGSFFLFALTTISNAEYWDECDGLYCFPLTIFLKRWHKHDFNSILLKSKPLSPFLHDALRSFTAFYLNGLSSDILRLHQVESFCVTFIASPKNLSSTVVTIKPVSLDLWTFHLLHLWSVRW